MLRRLRWHRWGAAVLALWFALFMGESLALRVCPMHDGGGASHAHAGHGARANATLAAAGGEAHGAHRASLPADPQSAPPTSPCDCLGQCLGSATLALVSMPSLGAVAEERLAARATYAAVEAPIAPFGHRLPFSIPPPARGPFA